MRLQTFNICSTVIVKLTDSDNCKNYQVQLKFSIVLLCPISPPFSLYFPCKVPPSFKLSFHTFLLPFFSAVHPPLTSPLFSSFCPLLPSFPLFSRSQGVGVKTSEVCWFGGLGFKGLVGCGFRSRAGLTTNLDWWNPSITVETVKTANR